MRHPARIDVRGSTIDVEHAFRGLEEWGRHRDWAGSDPYDGMNAGWFATPLRKTRRGRQFLTQVVKRSPVNLRPVLAIQPAQSAATLALVTSAYARQRVFDEYRTRLVLRRSVNTLLKLRSPGFDEACWGYHFDVQTRVFFYPRNSPNTIATAFAGLALLDAHDRTGDELMVRCAESAGEFFLRHVPQTPSDAGAYFGYLVGDRTPIHNASMLVAALLARLAGVTRRSDFRIAAEAAVAYTASRQRSDGSWPYGEQPRLGWFDSFHTGYVLEAFLKCGEAGVPAPANVLRRGLDYYRTAFFLSDGTPKYYADSVYPIDAQCAAQGMQTLIQAGPKDAEVAWQIFEYTRRHLRRADDAYVFQVRRFWRNRTPHMRWVVAPLLLAFAILDRAEPQ